MIWFLGERYGYDEGDVDFGVFDVMCETKCGADSRFPVSIVDLAGDARGVINQQQQEIAELKTKYNKAKSANSELKAMVNDYKDITNDLIGGAEDSKPFDVVVSRAGYERLVDHYDKTPAQSLQHHNASEIERVTGDILVASYNGVLDQDDIINYLKNEATKLREGQQ